MDTDKVIFVGEQWGATGSHGTGSESKKLTKSVNCFKPDYTSITCAKI
jgi:hypothetical protein